MYKFTQSTRMIFTVIGAVFFIILTVACLFISWDEVPEGNAYENIVPEMLQAVRQVNEEILQEKKWRLPLDGGRKLQSVKVISDVYIGDTVFYGEIPVGNQPEGETKPMYFSVSAEAARDITKISGISRGFEKSAPGYKFSGPDFAEKLSNGVNANYVYAVGVSRFQVYEYVYELRNFWGAMAGTETERAAVPAGDSIHRLRVTEEAVKVHIENSEGSAVLTWDSRSDYKKELTSADVMADLRAKKCIFF